MVAKTNGQKQCIEIDQSKNSFITQVCASLTQNRHCDLSEQLRDALKKFDRLFDLTNNIYNSISRLNKEIPGFLWKLHVRKECVCFKCRCSVDFC